jgi:hypothetical protein
MQKRMAGIQWSADLRSGAFLSEYPPYLPNDGGSEAGITLLKHSLHPQKPKKKIGDRNVLPTTCGGIGRLLRTKV